MFCKHLNAEHLNLWTLFGQSWSVCLSCHNPGFEINWCAMPKKRGLSNALSTPNAGLSSDNSHLWCQFWQILCHLVTLQAGCRRQQLNHAGKIPRWLVWSFFWTSCLWSSCFSHPSLLDSCKTFHVFLEANIPSLYRSWYSQGKYTCLVSHSDVTVVNSTARHPEHGQDWGKQQHLLHKDKRSWRTCWESGRAFLFLLGAGWPPHVLSLLTYPKVILLCCIALDQHHIQCTRANPHRF